MAARACACGWQTRQWDALSGSLRGRLPQPGCIMWLHRRLYVCTVHTDCTTVPHRHGAGWPCISTGVGVRASPCGSVCSMEGTAPRWDLPPVHDESYLHRASKDGLHPGLHRQGLVSSAVPLTSAPRPASSTQPGPGNRVHVEVSISL